MTANNSSIVDPSITNRQSAVRESAISNLQSVNLQSPICNLQFRLLPQQLCVLLLLDVVDQRDVLIGDLLDFFEAPPLVVLGNLAVFQQFLQLVIRVAAHL